MYEVNPKDDIFVQALNDIDWVFDFFLTDLDLELVDPSDVECLSTGSMTEAWQFAVFFVLYSCEM